ncbi:hypothetical protein [Blastococcus sp. TF02A-35]|uniref:hypothetical protein n=1 Tax=Blastococcus sp. TF02A-35 TaxID=2559612 RepID=UPI0010731E52|nr:hypothetical protein [Blastococcus sp. TF02A_35]TFV52142.1 hypothetical protein E4P43_07870 [Blastococcus sp. TF02A_35]
MRLRDALGIGPVGGTVVPVSVWLPVLLVVSTAAGALLATLERESVWLQLAVIAAATALVTAVSTAVTRRLERRRAR